MSRSSVVSLKNGDGGGVLPLSGFQEQGGTAYFRPLRHEGSPPPASAMASQTEDWAQAILSHPQGSQSDTGLIPGS